MSANLLSQETSPYLLQHQDNPVHWRPWGPEALAEARDANKPILLSVGYAACHWCHVMAHESFENDDIAALMNAHFINIKVDREERPDIDNIYQNALALLGEHGGWPLTMFLTPDGEPFWGGTYFPPEPKFGRPSFPQVLTSLAQTYVNDPVKVRENADKLKENLAKIAQPPSGEGSLTLPGLTEAASLMIRYVDPIGGGTHGAPKFPQPNFFQALWRAYLRTDGALFREAVTSTLNNICQGGIYDHVGGGFARYSTDAEWLVPHFEKMLYDNALLIELLSEAWAKTGRDLYEMRIRETVDWLTREMKSDAGSNGGFAFTSALDADSEGVEGKYYVWSETEIDDLLGADAKTFKKSYDVTAYGNWEGTTILNRSQDADFGDPDLEPQFQKNRETLLKVRQGRIPPQRDDKVLADWNGMMIFALAKAAGVFEEPAWLELAETAYAFIHAELGFDHGGQARLHHTWCAGQAAHPGVIDDYAQMTRAATALFEATGKPAYLAQAEAWAATADHHHWDTELGGYFLAADDTPDLLTRAKTHQDNATPAGNGVMMDALARLYHLTGKDAYRTRAEDLVKAMAGKEVQDQVHQTALMCGFELLLDARQIVVAGPAGDAATEALLATARKHGGPLALVTHVPDGDTLADSHPAAGKGTVDGKAAVYVCRGTTCSLPLTSPDSLTDALGGK